MKAMILAAGLGTRLRPLTDTKPKALIEVDNLPLIEHVLRKLIAAGISEVIINVHHFQEQIKDFLAARNNFGITVAYSEEPVLLDTGGGLKQAGRFFSDGEPFLLHNVDILSDIDLQAMLEVSRSQKSLALLAVNDRKTSRYFLFDDQNVLCGWRSTTEPREIVTREPKGTLRPLAFCGIHALSPAILNKLTEEGSFSIVDSYLRLAGEGEEILAFRADQFEWRDVGRIAHLT